MSWAAHSCFHGVYWLMNAVLTPVLCAVVSCAAAQQTGHNPCWLLSHCRVSHFKLRPCLFLQVLYKRVCEYLELDNRVEVLNTRFTVLQEMLDMLRDHQNNHHMARLEWIVIWLIVVEVIVGLFDLLGFIGWFGHHGD